MLYIARNASFLFQLMASMADTSCFVLLGMSVFSQQYAYFRADLVNLTFSPYRILNLLFPRRF